MTDAVSRDNSAFWDELCGTHMARELGITDRSEASLRRFDDWYFRFYPYLAEHIPFDDLKGRDVLEVGLGYGSVAQRLAESGCRYTGLDIAAGPVEMVSHRLAQRALDGRAIRGSILQAPFRDAAFDVIVAIGSLHHTGDLPGAIRQCHRLLRPGGRLIFMVYTAYSYRRWLSKPLPTAGYAVRELLGHRGVVGAGDERARAAYDSGAGGQGAPHTDWISIRSLRALCEGFSSFRASLENIDREGPFRWVPRERVLESRWPSRVGLDLYATAVK